MSVEDSEFWVLHPSSLLRRLLTSPDSASQRALGNIQIPREALGHQTLDSVHMSNADPCHTWHHELLDYNPRISQELLIPKLTRNHLLLDLVTRGCRTTPKWSLNVHLRPNVPTSDIFCSPRILETPNPPGFETPIPFGITRH